MNQFLEYFLGEFNNRQQSFAHPTRYSYVRLMHKKINDELIYGEQAYAFRDVRPYRQFVLRPIYENGKIRIINYDIKNPLRFMKGKNLDQLKESDLILQKNCNIIFTEKNGLYYGKIDGCECFVQWKNKQTYVVTDIILGKNYYNVTDKGMCVKTNTQLWGSQYGHFKFVKQ